MPSIGKLFYLPDAIVRIILSDVGMFKVTKNGDFILNRNGIDTFSGLNKFNNSNFEIYQVKFCQKKIEAHSLELDAVIYLQRFFGLNLEKMK